MKVYVVKNPQGKYLTEMMDFTDELIFANLFVDVESAWGYAPSDCEVVECVLMEKEYYPIGSTQIEHPKSKIWKPNIDEDYWYIADTGTVADACYNKDDFDNEIIDWGNFFKINSEAEHQSKVQKYTNLFRKYVEEHSEPIDWENDDQAKYCSHYDYYNSQIYFNCAYCHKQQGTIYANSKEILQDAISFIGEENFIKYVIGVE
jgi:hypothetical protein